MITSKSSSPAKPRSSWLYFSNILCLSISEFHLTSTCSPPGMCVLVLLLVVEAELPLLENYLHEGELEAQDVCVCCIAAIKWLRVWLHRVDMTTRYNEARANSPCSDDHKLGTLLDFLLIPENTGVGLKHIIDRVVAENVDALKMHLIKSKKLLKEALKSQTKLLTRLMKQKMTLREDSPLQESPQQDFEGTQPNNCTVGSGEDHCHQTHCRHCAHRGSARGL